VPAKYEQVFIGLGSNLEDRLAHLQTAVQEIGGFNLTEVLHCSSVYETEPVSEVEQSAFLNQVIQVATEHEPFDFLRELQQIELKHSRTRKIKWGPRTLDLDLLFWGGEIIRTPELVVPHPKLSIRQFVLVPLAEIAADFKSPVNGESVSGLLNSCLDSSRVVLFDPGKNN